MRQVQFLIHISILGDQCRRCTFRCQHSALCSAHRLHVPPAVVRNMGHLSQIERQYLCARMTIDSPRHDPGHRRGGAAPSGLPQAQTLAQSAAALSAHWVAEAPKGFMVKQEQLARPVSPEYSICEPQPTCSARSGGARARKPRRTAPTMPELMKLYQYFLIISECVVSVWSTVMTVFIGESTLLISYLRRVRNFFVPVAHF